MTPLYNTPELPIGSALDVGVTLQTLLARHTQASAQHATVIRGLLDLHRDLTSVVGALPDLGCTPEVARWYRILTNTLQSAATAYGVLHGRRVATGFERGLRIGEWLRAAPRDVVDQWLRTVTTR